MRRKEPPTATVGLFIFGLIASLASKALLKPEKETPFRDKKPTALSTRGTPLDYVIGRHRSNVVFALAVNRKTIGGVDYEEGVHVLHHGRIRAVHKVIDDGKVIHDFGPGGFSSVVNGIEIGPSTIAAPDGQQFTIFFGHPDPLPSPEYSELADDSRFGVASRWPGRAFVWWHDKKLDPIGRWPLVDYEYSVEPPERHLFRTEPWLGSFRDLDPDVAPQNIVGFGQAGLRWRLRISGDWVEEFQRAKWCQINFYNDPDESGKFEIDASSHFSPLGTQLGAPDSTIANLGSPDWSDVGSNPEWEAINDPSSAPVDFDYVVSDNPAATLLVGLTSITDPNNADNHSFKVRYRMNNPSGLTQTVPWQVEIINDATGAADPIFTHTFQEQLSGSGLSAWKTVEIPISVISAIGITDYSDIGARFQFTGQTGALELHISLFELVVVDPGRTEIYLHERHTFPFGISPTGDAQPYLDGMDGVNVAHSIAEILFSQRPRGRALPKTLFDLETFEVVGEQAVAEHLPVNGRWQEGPKANGVLGSIMQDVGCFFRWDPVKGLWGIQLVRATDPVLDVPSELLLGPLDEREKSHGPKKVNRVTYTFDDRARNFRTSTYKINDDGEASLSGDRRNGSIEVKTSSNFSLAKTIAERRALENEVTEGSASKLRFQGELRDLCPGQRVRLPGEVEIRRVESVKPVAASPRVEVTTVPDLYGVEAVSEAAQQSAVLRAIAPPPANDSAPSFNSAEALLELPDALSPSPSSQAVALLQIRGSERVVSSQLDASLDGGATYASAGVVSSFAAGGTLDAEFAAGSPYVEEGPTLTLVGLDAAELIQDLRADEGAWREGRQMAVIGSEIAFLESVTWIDNETIQLGRMLRAREGTRQETHAAGSTVYILPGSSLTPIEIPGIEPGLDLYWRTVPRTRTTQTDPDLATVRNGTLEGRGLVPPAPENLGTSTGIPAYGTGEDIVFTWTFRRSDARRVGAGRLKAGAVSEKAQPRGSFSVTVSDVGTGKSARLDGVSVNAVTLTNETIIERFGSEPDTIRIEVCHIADGFSSEKATLDVVKL